MSRTALRHYLSHLLPSQRRSRARKSRQTQDLHRGLDCYIERQESWVAFVVDPIKKSTHCFDGENVSPIPVTDNMLLSEIRRAAHQAPITQCNWTRKSLDPSLEEGYAWVGVQASGAHHLFPNKRRLFSRPVMVNRIKKSPKIPSAPVIDATASTWRGTARAPYAVRPVANSPSRRMPIPTPPQCSDKKPSLATFNVERFLQLLSPLTSLTSPNVEEEALNLVKSLQQALLGSCPSTQGSQSHRAPWWTDSELRDATSTRRADLAPALKNNSSVKELGRPRGPGTESGSKKPYLSQRYIGLLNGTNTNPTPRPIPPTKTPRRDPRTIPHGQICPAPRYPSS
ncbi:hypothetical protein ACJ73_06048 [Blastomyces percursus]|uniref:Uncharacterized protein n=1 Tax=Blastomyces percursus TaxID=1658174 RepID=A0A1J9R4P8_9EURO|nr:hypothetical protein ACJ73_06048 [Blastomyces percursus]